jgi:hypothetical protein
MGLLLSVSGTFKMCWRKHISRFDRVGGESDLRDGFFKNLLRPKLPGALLCHA